MKIPKKKLCSVRYNKNGHLTIQSSDCLHNAGLHPRQSSEFKNMAVFLHPSFDWVIGRDSQGVMCLVPLRKDK